MENGGCPHPPCWPSTFAPSSSSNRRQRRGSINARLCLVHRLCAFHFGEEAGWQDLRLRHRYLRRSLAGADLGRLRLAYLRLKTLRPVITPLTSDQVARFWASFRNCRDMALVALMLFDGLRSRETLTLRLEDVVFTDAQLRVNGKGRRQRLLPLPPETIRLLDLYLRTERPPTAAVSIRLPEGAGARPAADPCRSALSVSLSSRHHGRKLR